MKEKYKDWAMTLRLRDCKDPNCAYCGAANLLDRLSALPDEAPPADDFMERFRLEGAWYKGVNDRKWIDARHAWYEAKYPLAQARIAELEKQLAEAMELLDKQYAALAMIHEVIKDEIIDDSQWDLKATEMSRGGRCYEAIRKCAAEYKQLKAELGGE